MFGVMRGVTQVLRRRSLDSFHVIGLIFAGAHCSFSLGDRSEISKSNSLREFLTDTEATWYFGFEGWKGNPRFAFQIMQLRSGMSLGTTGSTLGCGQRRNGWLKELNQKAPTIPPDFFLYYVKSENLQWYCTIFPFIRRSDRAWGCHESSLPRPHLRLGWFWRFCVVSC